MKLNISKEDLNILCMNKKYEEIEKIVNFISEGNDPQTFEFIKQLEGKNDSLLVTTVCNMILYHNINEKLSNFVPYRPKKAFKEKFLKGHLTEEEKKYIKLFKRSINKFKKAWEGNVDKETYDALKQIYEIDKDEYYIGIHRTSSPLEDTFENGIRCRDNDLETHVQKMDNFDFMLSQISSCENYKLSDGCFIIKIPKKAVDEKSTPIFYENNGGLYLDPKYIVGYVPVRRRKLAFLELNYRFNDVNSTIYNENVRHIWKK